MYAAATIITETVNEHNKRGTIRRKENVWKIRRQRQISTWRKEVSVLAEKGTGSDNGKLNRNKGRVLQKYKVTNARETAQLVETLKQKVQANAQRIRRYEKRKPNLSETKCLRKTSKNFTET
jgi:hypothetical protein